MEENLGRKRQGTNGQKWESFSTKKSVKGGKVIKETSKELPGKQMKEKIIIITVTIKCYVAVKQSNVTLLQI